MRADTDRPLEAAGEAFGKSVVLARLSGGVDRLVAAWERSRASDASTVVTRGFSALPLDVRVRLIGLTLLSFAATIVAAGFAVPARVAAVYPALFWVPAAITGAWLISQPEGWAAAWSARRRRSASQDDQKKNA